MSDDAWIQQSLARLEALETQKEQYEVAAQPVPPELSAEISALYETLDAVASSESGAAPIHDDGTYAAGMPEPGMMHDPYAPASAMGGHAGMGFDPYAAQAPAPGYAGVPTPMSDYSMTGEMDVPKSKAPLVLGLVAVVGVVGASGFFLMQNKAEPPPPVPTGEAKVIGASEIPEDTQEPKAAEGADVSVTPLQEIPDGPDRSRSGHRGGGGGKRTGGGSNGGSSKDGGRKLEISDDSRDPLAGLK